MRSFFRYTASFAVTHLFFAVFLFFGLGIFTQMDDDNTSFMYGYVFWLCIIATIIQALIFSLLSLFFDIAGLSFFIIALVLELLISNSLFFYYVNNKGYSDEVYSSIIMNACLVAALFITLLIKEYQAQNSVL
jgi:hypothetical protein